MSFSEKENERFRAFVRFVETHKRSEYVLVFDKKNTNPNSFDFKAGERVHCTWDCSCDGDNCLDENDANYEEYYCVIFELKSTRQLFEVSYHNIPVEIWCDGVKIDFGEEKECTKSQ